jgi:hypothetical protein
MTKLVWLLVFFAAFFVHLTLERLNYFDSIGLWYTTYGAVISTAFIFAVFVVTRFLFRKVRKRRK